MKEMIEAVELCLESLDPKEPRRFNREELQEIQDKTREGLKLALAYLKERKGN
jgi:hypothetical protein